MIDCSSISRALDAIICKSKLECLEKILVLLTVHRYMPIGRMSLSAITGVSERKIRRYISEFRSSGLIRVDKVAGAEIVPSIVSSLMDDTDIVDAESYCMVLLSCSEECLKEVLQRYILFRDMIVVAMGSPFILEVIGFAIDGNIVFPGLPEELASKYLTVAKKTLAMIEKKACCFILVLSKKSRCCLRLVPAIYYAVDGICKGVYRLSDIGGFCG